MTLIKDKGCYYEPTRNGSTPLHAASKSGSIEIVNYFISKSKELKIDIDHKKNSGHTPLHFACFKGNHDIA
jgi:ankyrin repeat protein